MSIALVLSDTFETVRIEGDLKTLLGELNLAAASGKQYVISRDLNGESVLIDRNAIKMAREISEDEDAHIGRA